MIALAVRLVPQIPPPGPFRRASSPLRGPWLTSVLGAALLAGTALLSGFAFVVYFPLILGLDDGPYERATALSQDVYLGRWLLLCGAMFAVSARLYAARARRAERSPGGAA